MSATATLSKHPGLLEWLMDGESGMSSRTIVSVTAVYPLDGRKSEPYDPADFRRCEILLRRVPSLRSRMPRMRKVSPWWARLVDDWDRIVVLMEQEVPGCFDGHASGRAPKAYALIQAGRR